VKNPEKVSRCLKTGIVYGCVKINGPASLDVPFVKGRCWSCERKISVTIRDILYQPDEGSDYGYGRSH